MKRLIITALLFATPLLANADPVQFEDTSDKLGFQRGTESWGIAWGNLNRDGWPDLFNQGHRDFTRLYRNTGNLDFDDVAMEYDVQMGGWWLSNTQRDVHGGALGDFDNDGDDDIIVGDEDEFFINNAESGGYLTQLFLTTKQAYAAWVPSSTGSTLISETRCNGNYVQLIDLDNDGELDRICADADSFPENSSDAVANNLIPVIGNLIDTAVGDFDNDGLNDIVALRGAIRPNGAALLNDTDLDMWFRDGRGRTVSFQLAGTVTILVDGDGGGAFREASVVTHDSLSNLSQRVRNIEISYDTGTGTYTILDDSDSQHYLRVRADAPISAVQVDGLDSRDLPHQVSYGANTGAGIEWTTATGLTDLVSCVSVVTADFDNDMDLDLYFACREGVTNTANLYFENLGNGSFSLVTGHGAEGPIGPGNEFGVAESIATADYDVDGFMDLAVVNGLLFYPYGLGGPDSLFRNAGNDNNWVQFDLIGTTSNRNGMGAKVYVTAGGITQLREQNGGYHRWSQNDQRLHFGLAQNTVIDEIRIEWPSGEVDTFTNVGASQLYAATEGGSLMPVALGPEVKTEILEDEECGIPPYTTSYGPAMLLWRDCGTTTWRLRMRGGLGRLVENVPQVSIGTITADADFASIKGLNLETEDSLLLSNPMRIDFSIAVRDDGTANSKTIKFDVGGQASTCLDFTTQDIEAIIIGSSGKRLDPPFDLSNGLLPCDTDGDGINNEDDDDDDNDGFTDDVDAFPLDKNEWIDSDGDGVGDNSDAFPFDAAEQKDQDNDGIGDNADIDADNDGLMDTAELFDIGFTKTTDTFRIPADGGSATQFVDLSAVGAVIGESVLVTDLVADGDLDLTGEVFSLDFNTGEFAINGLRTEQQCVGTFYPTSKTLNAFITVIDIGGGIPGITIAGTTSSTVGDLPECGGIGLVYQLTISAIPAFGFDEDGDWIFNDFDLDSDNDSIADVVEAGLVDSDNDYIVDDLLGAQGTIAVAPDTDGDGIPDFLDLESGNPLNDGTAYDISTSAAASLDTNGDGYISSADTGGGIDFDGDGIDDLIDLDPTRPGSAIPSSNHPPTADSQSVTTSADTPLAIVLTGDDPDSSPLVFSVVSGPTNGSLSGTPPDLTYTPDPGFVGSDNFSFVVNDGTVDSSPASVLITVEELEQPLTAWLSATGGVSVSANEIVYSGSPTRWTNNTVTSVALDTLGYKDNFSVRWTVLGDPSASTSIVGVGFNEPSANWRNVDLGFRLDNGNLSIRENGAWRTAGPSLADGDTLTLSLTTGVVEYLVNDAVVFTSSYVGAPVFYVDGLFNAGIVSFAVTLVGTPDTIIPPNETPISSWVGATGGVVSVADSIQYSGSPTGWSNNTINSAPLSSLGAGAEFEVSFVIASDPAGTTWVVGFGDTETSSDWRDIDFGLRSSNGALTVYESGAWRTSGAALNVGDVLSIAVNGSDLEYRLNGIGFFQTTITSSANFYIDSSFKSAAVTLESFTLITP